MSRLTWAAVALVASAAPGVSAEIFKCAQVHGMDRYQNFPCAIDSIGSHSSGPTSATTPPVGNARQTRLGVVPTTVASTGTTANAREPRIGMTPDDVKAIWGEPAETDHDERKEGLVHIWRYADGRSVEFSHKQRVLTVRR